jgi:hypothetical protein
MRIVLRAFEHDGSLGAVGMFVRETDVRPDVVRPTVRPHAIVQMTFKP